MNRRDTEVLYFDEIIFFTSFMTHRWTFQRKLDQQRLSFWSPISKRSPCFSTYHKNDILHSQNLNTLSTKITLLNIVWNFNIHEKSKLGDVLSRKILSVIVYCPKMNVLAFIRPPEGVVGTPHMIHRHFFLSDAKTSTIHFIKWQNWNFGFFQVFENIFEKWTKVTPKYCTLMK